MCCNMQEPITHSDAIVLTRASTMFQLSCQVSPVDFCLGFVDKFDPFRGQVDLFDARGQIGTYICDQFSTQICTGKDDVLQAFEFVDYFLDCFVSR